MNESLEELFSCVIEIFVEKANNKDRLQTVIIEKERIVIAVHKKNLVKLFEIKTDGDVDKFKQYFL